MQGISNLLSNLASILQNMEIQDPGMSSQFTVGERLEAQVLSREGDNYLLQSGAKLFRAQSDLSLSLGEKLFLYVFEQKDGRTILKIELPVSPEYVREGNKAEDIKSMPNQVEQEQVLEKVRLLAAKHGFTGEKEISQLADQLAKLPVDEKAGIRYLLDPHLATAIVISEQSENNHHTTIEIEQYKHAIGNQRVWEVSLAVNLARLGPLEIVMKLIDGRIYARIWAEQTETEDLLRVRQAELNLQNSLVEIVLTTAGPLITRDSDEIIDLRV